MTGKNKEYLKFLKALRKKNNNLQNYIKKVLSSSEATYWSKKGTEICRKIGHNRLQGIILILNQEIERQTKYMRNL